MKIFRIITGILLIVWMILIFSLSSQDSSASSQTSGNLIIKVYSTLFPDFNNLSEEAKAEIVSSLQFFVRKTAHFTAYFILGILSFLTIVSYNRISYRLCVCSSALFCLVYAVSDEIHQYFVPGRSCEFRDVAIDFSGAVLAIILVSLLIKYVKRIYNAIRL